VSIIALHPEDLLERDARGELSQPERARLEQHLRHCSVCQLERKLRADFRQEEAPLGSDFDVHRLLSAVLAPGAPGAMSEVARPPRPSAMRRMRPALLVAAALFVAGASVAAGWDGIPNMHAHNEAQDAISTLSARRASSGALGRSAAATAARETPSIEPLPSLDVASSGAASGAKEVANAPVVVAPVKLTPGRTSPRVSSALSVAPSAAGLGTSASDGWTAPASDAAALFAQANVVRRSGDRAKAAELYRALVERFPRSAEAHEAEAALGHLLLGAGNASAALRYFDEYLYSSGPLEEDVRVDRALAFNRLHRSSDEADAWSSLLRTHPGSVHADRARARLRELGDR